MTWIVIASAVQYSSALHFTLFDDAMISMSYGRTLAETGEWVWYPRAPRVQGFTNPLWSLWMAAVHAIGLSGSLAALAIQTTSAVAIVATAVIAGQGVFRSANNAWGSARASGLMATAAIPLLFPLSFWSLRGMEVGLLALCAVVVVFAVTALLTNSLDHRWRGLSPILLISASCVGIATRTDFVIAPVTATIVALALGIRQGRSHKKLLALALAGAVVPLTALIAVLGFQFWYWGSALPNTYYLKMTGYSIFTRLERGLLSDGKLIPILLLTTFSFVLLLRMAKSRREISLAVIAFFVFIATVAYNTYVGADAWETFKMANRYVAVALPLASVVITLGFPYIQTTVKQWTTRNLAVAFLLITGSGLFVGIQTNPVRLDLVTSLTAAWAIATGSVLLLLAMKCKNLTNKTGTFFTGIAIVLLITIATSAPRIVYSLWVGFPPDANTDASMSQRGQWISSATSSDATIASLFAGAPIYYANRRAIDLLGKSDPFIARMSPNVPENSKAWNATFYPGHNKWDVEYSIVNNRPDLILNYLATTDEQEALLELGYRHYCLPDGYRILVLAESPRVVGDIIKPCP